MVAVIRFALNRSDTRSADRLHFGRQQVSQQVDVMRREIEQNPSAIRARKFPGGKTIAGGREHAANRDDLPGAPRLNLASKRGDQRVKSIIESGGPAAATGFPSLDDTSAIVESGRDRFFKIDVLPRLERRDGRLGVKAAGKGDQHRVDVLASDGVAPVGVGLGVWNFRLRGQAERIIRFGHCNNPRIGSFKQRRKMRRLDNSPAPQDADSYLLQISPMVGLEHIGTSGLIAPNEFHGAVMVTGKWLTRP